MTGDTAAVYNTAEFYALRILELSTEELTSTDSRSAAMIETINEVNDRFGSTGLSCLVAALGRIGTTELAIHAEQYGTTVGALIDEWRQHKLQQHTAEDEDQA